jgi:hypothetical protein
MDQILSGNSRDYARLRAGRAAMGACVKAALDRIQPGSRGSAGAWVVRAQAFGPNRTYLRFEHDKRYPLTSNMPAKSRAATAMRSSPYGAFRIH